jgi:hypothetical protein
MANFNALVTCLASIVPAGTTNAIQYNGGSGNFAAVGPLTSGQVLIGSTGAAARAATLTAGTGVAITNNPGSITIATTGGGSGGGGSGLFSQVLSPTPTAASTGFGSSLQGTAVAQSNIATGVYLSGTGAVASCFAAPTPPFSYTALLVSLPEMPSGTALGGLGWSDGVKYQIVRTDTSSTIYVQDFSNVSTYSGTNHFGSSRSDYVDGLTWLKIYDDGTNANYLISKDGVNFFQTYAVAKSSGYLSAYKYVCFNTNLGSTTGNTGVTLLSWKQGTN